MPLTHSYVDDVPPAEGGRLFAGVFGTDKDAVADMEHRLRAFEKKYRRENTIRSRAPNLFGYAAVYGYTTLNKRRDGYRERLNGGCFSDVLASNPNVVLTIDHAEIVAQTTDGTLKLHDHEAGLAFCARLSRPIHAKLARAHLSGCSFTFDATKSTWGVDGGVAVLYRAAGLTEVSIMHKHRPFHGATRSWIRLPPWQG